MSLRIKVSPTRVFPIENKAAAQIIRENKCRKKWIDFTFLHKKTSIIKIAKAPSDKVISGESNIRFMIIYYRFAPKTQQVLQNS